MLTIIKITAFLMAFIIVVTKTILSVMEEKDRAKGYVINPEEYKISGILKIMANERMESIKAFFRKVNHHRP